MQEPRESVQWFACEMEKKLAEHDDRPGWSGEDSGWLLDRLREEVEELQRAIDTWPEQRSRVIGEAADVANFAHMIADNHRRDMLSVERFKARSSGVGGER